MTDLSERQWLCYEKRHSRWYERLLLSLPFQMVLGLLVAVVLPGAARWGIGFWHAPLPDVRLNTLYAIGVCFFLAMFTLRRLRRYPGVQVASYIIPTISSVFLVAIAILFFTRAHYTRLVFFTSYFLCLLWFFAGYYIGRRYHRLKFAVVPIGKALQLKNQHQVDFDYLNSTDMYGKRYDGVVADLHSDALGKEWERFLARCTLSGIPVYNVKQIQESVTGRVRINHLSENEFGSLQPSPFYRAFKRFIDIVVGLAILPLLLPIMGITAVIIRLDSSGPALFLQKRMGYRGQIFTLFKFRSMYTGKSGKGFTDGDNDPRITKVGKIIRKYRIDELPQIFNVLKGDMSFIGPRPESLDLSAWYERDVPFFSYRHIVRPGISGWAQVEQGYAAEVAGMTTKLQYDFYYIKHFSLWIDLLILFKTIKTIFTGYGAR